jgi:hypothetical protein
MTQPCAYAKEWSFNYDRLYKPMTEAEARGIHTNRKPFTGYSAIFGSPTQPTHIVREMFNETATFFVVTWLDSLRRKHTEFQFKLLEPARLFLILASEFWYEGESGKVVLAVHYNFKPDGHVHVDKFDKVTMTREFKDEVVDVYGNWEPLPSFGDYGGVLVKERDRRHA